MAADLFAAEGDVAEDEDFALQIEVDGLGHREEIHQGIGVLRRGPNGVLFGTIIQDQLEGELARLPSLLLVPVRVYIGDLAYLDLLLYVLLAFLFFCRVVLIICYPSRVAQGFAWR